MWIISHERIEEEKEGKNVFLSPTLVIIAHIRVRNSSKTDLCSSHDSRDKEI